MGVSFKVMKLNEFNLNDGIYIFYKLECSCGRENDSLSFEMAFDKNVGDITLTHYFNINWCSYWGLKTKFKEYIERMKVALKILLTGYIELNHSLIIQGEEHINSYIEALNEGKEKIKQWEKENN